MLIGPSGSGKTTPLSILGYLLAPLAGVARVRGESIVAYARTTRDHLAPLYRFVFQSYHLFSTLTAAENVELALDVRASAGRRRSAKAEEVLAGVGLSKLKSFPRQLSSGEQQRAAIARAIVADQSIVLADEPTAALDSGNGTRS